MLKIEIGTGKSTTVRLLLATIDMNATVIDEAHDPPDIPPGLVVKVGAADLDGQLRQLSAYSDLGHRSRAPP